jgi:hypothetical protein
VRFLDLNAHPGTTMLAPNFRLDEVAQTWKGRYAVVQPGAIGRLQAVRNQVGALVVNSGYRSPGYNSGVGGATWSRHMYGDGFDLDPSSASLTALQSACQANGAGYTQVYATHVHCDWRSDTVSVAFYGTPFWGGPAFVLADSLPTVDAELVWDGEVWTAPAFGWDEGEPLREWVALDADDYAIAIGTGETFSPPAGTATVEVWVGREITRTAEQPAP